MIVELIKQKYTNKYSFKIKKTKYCCEGIKNNETIGISYCNCEPRICINSTQIVYCDGENFEHEIVVPIQYCPHCGRKILLEVVDVIDYSEEYEKLKSNVNSLTKKYLETDSIKERSDIEAKVNNPAYF